MDWRILAVVISSLTCVFGALILYYRWVSKHTSDSTIHPIKTSLVATDVCVQVQKTNETAHAHLSDCIEGQERRTGERFTELKEDMHRGFAELKRCIHDNSHGG